MKSKLFEDRVFFKEKEVERITKLSLKAIKHWQKKIKIFSELRNNLKVDEGFFSKTEVELLMEAKRLILEEEKSFDEVDRIFRERVLSADEGKKKLKKEKEENLKTPEKSILKEIKKELSEILKILKSSSKL